MRAALVLVGMLVVGCGSSDDGSSTSPSGAQALTAMSNTEKAAFCDEIVGRYYGGYGKSQSTQCPREKVTVLGPKTQAQCVTGLARPAGCAETRSEEEGCVKEYVENLCAGYPARCKTIRCE